MEALEARMRRLKGLIKVDPGISVSEDPMMSLSGNYKVGPEGVKTEVSVGSGTGWGLDNIEPFVEMGETIVVVRPVGEKVNLDTLSLRGKKGSERGFFEKIGSDQVAPVVEDVVGSGESPVPVSGSVKNWSPGLGR
ncbi:hypothetical protein U1Q18_049030 [Sarracenia purpurea var. burkii]